MNIEDIHGWMTYTALYRHLIDRTPNKGVCAEVGVWMGKSAATAGQFIKDSGKDIQFWAIDPGFGSIGNDADLHKPFVEANGGNNTGKMLCNLRDCRVLDYVIPLPITSIRAASLFPDNHFDWVFIDGDHRKEAVLADLQAWWPKIKIGGTIAGHDYKDGHWRSVDEAVDEFFGREVRSPICNDCFQVEKT